MFFETHLNFSLTFCFPWQCFHGENENEASAAVCTTAVLKMGTSCLHTQARTLMFPKYIAVDSVFPVLNNLDALVWRAAYDEFPLFTTLLHVIESCCHVRLYLFLSVFVCIAGYFCVSVFIPLGHIIPRLRYRACRLFWCGKKLSCLKFV